MRRLTRRAVARGRRESNWQENQAEIKTLVCEALELRVLLSAAYGLIDLGAGTSALGINSAGEVVGNNAAGPFQWSIGTGISGLGVLPQDSSGALDGGTIVAATASGINDSGNVVGTAFTNNGLSEPFIWSQGAGYLLPAPGTRNGAASAINSSGDIVGSSGNHADKWLASGGSTSLSSGVWNSWATSINDSGIAVGYLIYDLQDRGLIWSVDGKPSDLPNLGGSLEKTQPTDINNVNQIVGSDRAPGGGDHAFLYANGSMSDLGTLGGTFSQAVSINNEGTVVGKSNLLGDGQSHAFIYETGAMTDLNALLDGSGSGWTVTAATGINDVGQIVGSAVDPQGQTHAVLLSPVTALPFFDNFNRPDSAAVGNGWQNTAEFSNNLEIRNGTATQSTGDQRNGIYRPIPSDGPITVSATISQTSGFNGSPGRYVAELALRNDGKVGDGYRLEIRRGDSSYSDSKIELFDGATLVGTALSSFQFGASVHIRYTVNTDGSVVGQLSDPGGGFSEFSPAQAGSATSSVSDFSFGPHVITSSGTNFLYWQSAPDSSGIPLIFHSLDDLSLSVSPVSIAPQPPTNVQGSDGTFSDHVHVSWDAVTAATSYEVWRNSTNDTGSATRISDSVSDVSYDDSSAVPGTTYFYWTKAKNVGGASDFSASDAGFSKVVIPSLRAPTLLSPVNQTVARPFKPQFIWSQVSGNAGYRIIVATDPAALPTDPNDPGGTGSAVVINRKVAVDRTFYQSATPLVAGKTYYWEVHALGATQGGNWSTPGTFTTAAAATNALLITAESANGRAMTSGTIIRYDSTFHLVDSQLVQADGTARWLNVAPGTYNLELYSSTGDFWAQSAVTIQPGNSANNVTIRQNEPYEYDLQVYSGNKKITGQDVTVGTRLRFELRLHNGLATTQNGEVSFQLAHNQELPLDYTATRSGSVGGNSDASVSFYYTPKDLGDIRATFQIQARINGRLVTTDSGSILRAVTAVNKVEQVVLQIGNTSNLAFGKVTSIIGTAPTKATVTVHNNLALWMGAEKTLVGSATSPAAVSPAGLFAAVGLAPPEGDLEYAPTFAQKGDQVSIALTMTPIAAAANIFDLVLPLQGINAGPAALASVLQDLSGLPSLKDASESLIHFSGDIVATSARILYDLAQLASDSQQIKLLKRGLVKLGFNFTKREITKVLTTLTFVDLAKTMVSLAVLDGQLISGIPISVSFTK